MSRNYTPTVSYFLLLLGSVSALSLTAFAVEDVPDKLGIVLGLILALIFVELPPIPIVTFVDKYFYVCFAYLVAISAQSAFATNDFVADYNNTILGCFIGLFVVIHVVFGVSAFYTSSAEKRKITMTADEISKLVEEGMMKIDVYCSDKPKDMEVGYDKAIFHAECEPKRQLKKSKFAKEGFEGFDVDFGEITGLEWFVIFCVILLQFPIGMSELIAKRSDPLKCRFTGNNVHGVTDIEMFFYVIFSCLSFSILMFIYLSVGVSKNMKNILVFVLYVLLALCFLIEVDFLAWATVKCDLDLEATGEGVTHQVVQWWLITCTIVLYTILLLLPFIVLIIGSIANKYSSFWDDNGFPAFMLCIWHSIVIVAGVYQWAAVLSYNQECSAAETEDMIIDRIHLEENAFLLTAEIYFMLVLTFLRLVDDILIEYFEDKEEDGDEEQIELVIIGFGAMFGLLQFGVAWHSFIFWVDAIAVGMPCIALYHQIILVCLFGVWAFIGCCGCCTLCAIFCYQTCQCLF